MKLHLVDGTYELFRAFFSRPAQHAPDGRPVNAVSGLIDSLLSLLREPDVTHVGVATAGSSTACCRSSASRT